MVEYEQIIDRNMGILTREQQDVLKNATVAVFGLGGLGGVVAEVLCRSGICSLSIVDRDVYEPTNLNRQNFAFLDTVGRLKTDVCQEYLRRINPGVQIDAYTSVSEGNIADILRGCSVAVLAIDQLEPCITISRAARAEGIPLVEGWAMPFGNVRVFDGSTPTLEETYDLPTTGRDLAAVSEEELAGLGLQMQASLKRIRGLEEYYPPPAVERWMRGETPSFAPMVWLTAVLMSLEAVKILLGMGSIHRAPDFCLYDPFSGSIPSGGANEDH